MNSGKSQLTKIRSSSSSVFGNRIAVVSAGLLIALLLGLRAAAAETLSAITQVQIESLILEKEARTPAERKMDSQLVYFAKQSRNQPITSAVTTLQTDVRLDLNGRVLLDITAAVSRDLLDFISQGGGLVMNSFAAYNAVRAWLPVAAFETLASRPDVRFIEPAIIAITNTGPVTSQGDRTHRADTARATFATNDGSGIKIGVSSNGVASLETSIANGEINANATIIAGQAGTGDEGTAIMEIVQDIVPNAQIFFATAFSGPASMAANILALQAAGCSIIVDDVTYLNESPFQDQVISQAVNTVSAAGVMYFSSARNSGSKDKGTAGTWEGDFADGGAASIGTKTGRLHDFGGGDTFNTVTSVSSNTNGIGRVDLFWPDPLGASSNDYDLFVTDSAGTVLRSSTNLQNGSQDPYETVNTLNVNERIVIVKAADAAARFLHVDTGRSRIATSTAGNVRGHNAAGATNAFSVAATNAGNSPSPNFFVGGSANPTENFSSDGPRRIFFTPSGTAITPGDFSATGGQVLNKPDFTAADGVATSVPGFTTFFGTSAAAPHAAAIAALIKSYNPSLTPLQIRTILTSTALDIEGAGYDRDAGSGIIMALAAIQAAQPAIVTVAATGATSLGEPGSGAQPIGVFQFTRTGSTASALTVNFTVSGTATSGADYTSIGTSVTFSAGSAFAILPVSVIDDNMEEATETIVVTLDGGSDYIVGSPDVATYMILDDDATVTVAATDATAGEPATGQGTGTFTFTRTGFTANALTINFTVGGTATNGSDYMAIGPTVTFAGGSSTATETVSVIDDLSIEGNETVIVTLAAGGGYTVGSPAAATVTIQDDAVFHSADTNLDFKISPLELSRVIDLYNTRNGATRTGCYRVDATGEDGFAPDQARAPGAVVPLEFYHSADINQDGRISPLELSRVIELYNYRNGTVRTGQYHVEPLGEDGFAPGP